MKRTRAVVHPGSHAAECRGKARFQSPCLAWRAARRRPGRRLYRCRFCGGWHVGGGRKR
ncbi:hypothetical protein SAMN05421742_11186 [Roseospirillum parvum]|uniref:Uncharacterized protein n=1 Tax=Roseospirillum parvum TaxID=83401 RepID=A0A1G8EZ00_9PROT|nr:hypothetical protein SAMN05421742_11186 [Roseospirillum parvum]